MNLCDSLSGEANLHSSTAVRGGDKKARPGPHDPEKALRGCKPGADDRDAVSRGFRGGQHGAWWLLHIPVKEEKKFIFS